MGLGDVQFESRAQSDADLTPKQSGGHVCTRTFTPHKCHAAIGVLMAVTVGTACLLPDSVARGIVRPSRCGPVQRLSIEHPSGEFSVEFQVSARRPYESGPLEPDSNCSRALSRRTAGAGNRVGGKSVPYLRRCFRDTQHASQQTRLIAVAIIGFGEVGGIFASDFADARNQCLCF